MGKGSGGVRSGDKKSSDDEREKRVHAAVRVCESGGKREVGSERKRDRRCCMREKSTAKETATSERKWRRAVGGRRLEAVGAEQWDELRGIRFGGSFRWMKRAWRGEEQARSELEAPSGWRKSKLRMPVELLDSMFQTSLLLGEAVKRGSGEAAEKFMAPFAVSKVVVSGGQFSGEAVAAETRVEERGKTRMVVSVKAAQERGMRVRVERLTLVEATQETFQAGKREEKGGAELMYEVVGRASGDGRRAKRVTGGSDGGGAFEQGARGDGKRVRARRHCRGDAGGGD
jgi:hypothetical protein